ncbi:hypothetical protein DICVIV_04937 [Dictyocaulus viviparus]|uniref:Uncharacterized protein n=1 Tax=Dictyocaulus viviparus TaxID=29172 RepID=A0A0D8XYP2_DICVI|nr:hypothetical protein DICVIV_04937 [Dictyocaulus viviparus]
MLTTNMIRQQSDTTAQRRLIRAVAVEDDHPQTSQGVFRAAYPLKSSSIYFEAL